MKKKSKTLTRIIFCILIGVGCYYFIMTNKNTEEAISVEYINTLINKKDLSIDDVWKIKKELGKNLNLHSYNKGKISNISKHNILTIRDEHDREEEYNVLLSNIFLVNLSDKGYKKADISNGKITINNVPTSVTGKNVYALEAESGASMFYIIE